MSRSHSMLWVGLDGSWVDRMKTLEGLIGKIPSNPLWSELLATRQREREERRIASSTSMGKERRSASGVRGEGKSASGGLGGGTKTR